VTLIYNTAPAPTFLTAVSPAVTELVDRVRPSVVQLRSGGRGNGTGVAWRADGSIITNDHVVAHAGGKIQVGLTDGRTLDAEVAARAPELDLALLRVDARDLPAAAVADSRGLRVGELVFAVGHPWGQPWVVTAGIVSGLGEAPVRGGRETAPFIRSDVRLAPGNSGGPLLNARGEVVGINAMIFGGDLAVAIPSHVAAEWLAAAPDQPQERRAFLGVQVQPVEPPPGLAGSWAGRAAGLLVLGLEPGGAAARAGLLVGDVILDVAGEPVESPEALRDALAARAAPGRARFYLLRGGAPTALDVTLG
jgi:serine protease Do